MKLYKLTTKQPKGTDSNKAVKKYNSKFQKLVEEQFNKQMNSVLDAYTEKNISKYVSLGAIISNNMRKVSNIAFIEDLEFYDNEFLFEMQEIFGDIYLAAALQAINDVVGGATITMSVEKANSMSIEYAKKHSGELIQQINSTTRDIVRKELANAISEGFSVKELTDVIKHSTAFSDKRAEKIARTEIVNAHIQGNLEIWNESGMVGRVEWYTGIDERVCKVCNSNHKHVRLTGLPFPSGALHPPAHPNCRCDLLPVLDNSI